MTATKKRTPKPRKVVAAINIMYTDGTTQWLYSS